MSRNPSLKLVFTGLLLIYFAGMAGAQIMTTSEVVHPTAKEQGSGGVSPYFWVGAQAVQSLGYGLGTGAFGLRNHTADTWASFNVAFVDSHYDTPKMSRVGIDPEAWTGSVTLTNYTLRINSWTTTREANLPSWKAEIQGQGFHIGFFTQAGALVEATGASNTSAGDNNPKPALTSGSKVMYFNDANAVDSDFYVTTNPLTAVNYGGTGLVYGGYEHQGLFKAYLSLLSEGDVASLSGNVVTKDGWAAALDLAYSPFGLESDEEHPLIVNAELGLLAGFAFNKNPIGLGLKLNAEYLFGDNLSLAPVLAFDGKFDDTSGSFTWQLGGGLIFGLSGKRWVGDSWGELSTVTSYFDTRYENSKILKYSYGQIYLAYSETTDLDIAIKFEEPDGIAGFDENLGAMVELRLNNVAQTAIPLKARTWSLVSRVSYDLANHSIIPYLRAYTDSNQVLKLRSGVQMSLLPHTGFELAYTSRNLNLNHVSTRTVDKYDSGKLEFICIIKSDAALIHTPQRLSDWDY